MIENIKNNMTSLEAILAFVCESSGKVVRKMDNYKIPNWFFAEIQIDGVRYACSKKDEKLYIYFFNEDNHKIRGFHQFNV
jgi:hypothetical protein